MSVWTTPSGIMVQSHESFTHPFAGSGIEVHGTEGSVFARDVMTQRPSGTITLTDKAGTFQLNYEQHELYGYGLKAFNRAVTGHGVPAADGVDGLKSLAVALAVARSAREGRAVDVDYKGY